MSEQAEHLRMLEALLFAAAEPLDLPSLAARLPDGADLPALLTELAARHEGRGVNLVKVARKWAFRTAPDLAFLMEREKTVTRRLSRAAVETLAIIAYHQPVTRAEIEEVRGVGMSRGTLDMLMESNWVRVRGRRRSPGRPVTYGTTDEFLNHFNLEDIGDLPGVEELKRAGLLQPDPLASATAAAGSSMEASPLDGSPLDNALEEESLGLPENESPPNGAAPAEAAAAPDRDAGAGPEDLAADTAADAAEDVPGDRRPEAESGSDSLAAAPVQEPEAGAQTLSAATPSDPS